jgi:peptide/nickel transport system substrate-binding protein
MADKLITGGSRVPRAPCYPPQFGCDENAAVKYAYDPAKARQLLAEAGFPNGFETELVSYNPHSGLLPCRTICRRSE